MLRSKILIYILMLSCMYGAKYLAVLDLEPAGLSNTEAKILTQRLTSKMIALSDYTIVERANIDKILKEQKFQHSGCTDSECAVEIGQLLNADLTVIGTASKFGKTYTLDCRIINVENGEALHSASYTHTGEIDELVKDGIESIAHKLLEIPFKKKISSGTTSKASSGYGATLDINSDPPGAEVYIGGNYFDTTPLVLEDFPSGEYEVSIKFINFKDYTELVKLQPRGKNMINADLLCLLSIDCEGICNGTAVEDCTGLCHGSAELTDCGCNEVASDDNDCCADGLGPNNETPDCAGVCGGSAAVDYCGECGGDGSTCADCAGVPNGDSTLDNCGVCDGDNSSCEDCAGVPNGSNVVDNCGTCDNDPENDCKITLANSGLGGFAVSMSILIVIMLGISPVSSLEDKSK